MERYLICGLLVAGGYLLGSMVTGIFYERRYRRALELEREREKMRYYRQLGE